MSKYTAVLDVGTTSVRCFIYDDNYSILATAARDIENLIPQHGYSEIEPDVLYESCTEVIRSAVDGAKVSYADIVLGISTLRS